GGTVGGGETDGDGRLRWGRLDKVPYFVTVYAARDHARAQPVAALRGVQPGGDELQIRVADAAIPTSAIEGIVLDVDGKPPATAKVQCTAEGLPYQPDAKVDQGTGRFRLAPLPPGTWRVQVTVQDGEFSYRRGPWSEPFALAAKAARDVGVLQMPKAGSIALTVRGPDGKPLDG